MLTMTVVASTSTGPICALRSPGDSRAKLKIPQHKPNRALGNFSHFAQVVGKDVEFVKKGIGTGLKWANKTFRIPQVSKAIDDIVWLRNLEDPRASSFSSPSWPHPCYPELTGMDLLMADLKALEAYTSYFICLTKMWSKPLPEVYDPQAVADYFSCRPHVVAFRLLEVFMCFAAAYIRIRTSGLTKLGKPSLEKSVDGDVSQYNLGIVLKETMLNLGPTFVKVGQSLSTRPDIIGTEICKALSELHDQIPPFPRPVAMKIIEEELGSPLESFFRYISEEHVAAASFGQVYRGCTVDGIDVAVKVQRPNLRHVVVRDVYILRLGLGIVRKIAKRKYDIRLYADELGNGLVGELDYRLEAANCCKFSELHSRFGFVSVPKVLQHLTRKRVLTMEWLPGESPTELLALSSGELVREGSLNLEKEQLDAKRRLLDLVNKGVEASLVQLIETGLLHADPHPGNLRYTSSGKIGFLDFGLLCQMEKKHQFAMLASIVHIVNGDWGSLVRALVEMDVVRPGTNIRRVTLELEYALGEVEFKDGIPDVKFSRVLGKIWSVALKHQFRMPPYYTLVLRSLASLEGLAIAADTSFKTFEAAYPYVVRKLLTENSSETRKILYSVMLNKRREFQWQRLALFLRVGAARKGLQQLPASSYETSNNRVTSGFDTASFVLRLLPSKDGIVLRRLLMNADGASLIRAFVSKDAASLRRQLCSTIADILYKWMTKIFGQGLSSNQYTQMGSDVADNKEFSSSSRLSMPVYHYSAIVRDRRLRLIFQKVLKSARRDRILMLRFCCTSVVMMIMASAIACHRAVVLLSESYLVPILYPPKRYAMNA